MRKVEIDVKEQDYLDFLSICIEEKISVEKKLQNIIRYHLITYRNRRKAENSKLFSYAKDCN